MSNTKLLRLRSFLTERLTTAAVEIFGEIETTVEAYYEENKRLRNVLHVVLNPEIKLSKIDVGQYSGASQGREQPCELRSRLEQEILEPLPKKPKEEPIEYDISQVSEQQEGLGEVDNCISTDCVKNETEEEDVSMPCITHPFHIEVIEFRPDSSGALEPGQENCSPSVSGAITDNPQLHKSEQSTSQSLELQKPDKLSTKNGVKPGRVSDMVFTSTKPKQFTVADGVRSTRYKAVRGELPDPDVLKVSEAYKDFSADIAPLITTMAISVDVPLVNSTFGKVQEGSPISYQHPLPLSRVIVRHPDAPPPPPLPVDGYRLEPTTCEFVGSHQEEHLHLLSLATTLLMARKIEVATREQSDSVEWHRVRRPRITSSRFREVCHVRGQSSAENLAQRIRKGVAQTASMKRGLALEPFAIQEYCRIKNTNYWPCGFVIHPDAPWLGASPDGLVFDPTESPPFGLVEIKCPNVKSYVDCSYLKMQSGTLKLKQSHSYYWQVQGQLLLTGMEWCDLVVFAEEDILIQRICRDCEVAATIREKGDYFYFYFYMD
ncbi:uncharacterized protein LOC117540949 isoform X2 [Gymnodraco acuticeps]|uniref:Uncharacterized protein LOC117540949 isoform X2 n=1 Tax=Gymnodraco acuticeps TaxID=8218 RepID=A0A6P8TIH2_GYMAC|nr:uncharacterized protein LOC117540949 isoform X2 [Gymnodraco acuticeps]